MSEPWSTPSAERVDDAPDEVERADLGGADELEVLDRLEADLSAVEQAIESLEQVSTEGLVGEAAARRIAAAVSVDRFGPGA